MPIATHGVALGLIGVLQTPSEISGLENSVGNNPLRFFASR